MRRFGDRLFVAALWLSAAVLLAGASPARSGEPAPFAALAGVEVARDAALSWAADARLVYLENDEDVAIDGTAGRWGYVFHSKSKGKARGYSIRDGKILEAADLGFDFEAPPLSDGWIDSGRALAAADKKAGEDFRVKHGGRLTTMLLIRGAFNDRDPDASTWAVVYTSETEPVLLVIVDAENGDVVRIMRG
jgi:hypothetical protein